MASDGIVVVITNIDITNKQLLQIQILQQEVLFLLMKMKHY